MYTQEAFLELLKGNNMNWYRKGYANGFLAGGIACGVATLVAYASIEAIYLLGKHNGKKEARNSIEIEEDISEEE